MSLRNDPHGHGVETDGPPFLRTEAPFEADGPRLVAVDDLGPHGVTDDGCLECPWHRARYDVRTGAMREGPKGRVFGFKPYSSAVRGFANSAWRLETHAVEVRDGVIFLL